MKAEWSSVCVLPLVFPIKVSIVNELAASCIWTAACLISWRNYHYYEDYYLHVF